MTPTEVFDKCLVAINGRDREAWMTSCSPDIEVENRAPGAESWGALYDTFTTAFPDIHYTVERTIQDGEYLAVEMRVTGTHTGILAGRGAFPEVLPTGKRIDAPFIGLLRVVDAKVVRFWFYGSDLSVGLQLGVLGFGPAPAVLKKPAIPT